jgi:hypothetical protein
MSPSDGPAGSHAPVPRTVRRRLPDALPAHVAFVTLLFAAGLFGALRRLSRLAAGVTDLHPDVRLVWYDLAREVAAGTPLYTGAAVDNKPPLFELLNVGAYLTGEYVLVLLLVVGLANGVAAVLLWRTLAARGHPRVGALGALLFLLVLPLVDGVVVNVRSLAVAGLLFAFATRSPVARGVGVAGAVLCSQHAAFVLPVVAYDGYVRAGRSRRWLARFVGSGGAVAALVYGAVLAVWGWPSLAGALHASVGRTAPYLLSYGPSVFVSTGTWWRTILRTHLQIGVVLVLAVWGLGRVLVALRRPAGAWREWGTPHLLVALLVTSSLPLVVRPFVTYWVYPLPAIAVLAAFGADAVLTGARELG